MSNEQYQEDPTTPLMGSFLTTIIDEERNTQPHISEYQFKRDVLGILKNPFAPQALVQYSHYVYKLTNPLHVTADNSDEVLFSVPPLVGVHRPTMATEGGVTADIFFSNYVQRQRDLANREVNREIYDFLSSITDNGNYYIDVLQPIQEILARYNEVMDPIPGLTEDMPAVSAASNSTTASGSTFTDEYDDD